MRRALLLFAVPLTVLLSSPLFAQTGVSDDRVSLPEGPGSLEGIGENVEVDPNMGQMAYAVSVPLPGGYREMSPSVSLRYNSGGGASEVGMGWALPVPSIERMTAKGLPTYADGDRFTGPAGELVRVSDGEPAIYRARFEGGFARYLWYGRGEGGGGHWVVEQPDGKVHYYGADKDGAEVAGARLTGDRGVFRYRLVDQVDVFGHYIRWGYARFGATTLPTSLSWVHGEDGEPRYRVRFEYEGRPDFVSDAKPGFIEVLEHRLRQIRVLHRDVQLSRWQLTYEDRGGAGMSRLAQVERFGLRGGRHPVAFTFAYSDSGQSGRPFLVDMGSFGANPQSGNVTLVDLNGDALPDFLDTTDVGSHRIALSQFRGPRQHTLGVAYLSEVGTGVSHDLSAGNVQTLDVDGDGYSDLLNTVTGEVLENKGASDWTRRYSLFEDAGALPDLEGDLDPEDGDLTSIRFLDVDNDKRIDVVKSEGAGPDNITQVFLNTGAGFSAMDGVEPLGFGFDSDRLQLADMNGDGLLDAVRLGPSVLSYRINLGHGRWSQWIQIDDIPFEAEGDLEFLELEDLDNDGLSDLVLVGADEVRYALSENAARFGPLQVLRSADVDGGLPFRDAGTTVLFADMNASGSTDIVWVDELGAVRYVELFAVQPNLLARVDNGIGMVTQVTYGTASAASAAAKMAGQPWRWSLPYPSSIITSVDTFDTHSDVHQVTRYDYRDSYYDGDEKVPRGFARVTVSEAGDESIAAGRTDKVYDVGDLDPYRASLLLREVVFTDDVPLREVNFRYEDCDVDGVGATQPAVRYMCQREVESTVMEGGLPEQWRTTRVERTFDGFGNLTLEASLGVVAIGGEPCGDDCRGDESYKEVSFVPTPPGRWILNRPQRSLSYGRPGSDQYRESIAYYDGPAFEGLAEGQMERGVAQRVSVRVRADEYVDAMRLRHDAHGNPVEGIRETGTLDDDLDQRIRQHYGAEGFQLARLEVRLRDLEGQPYSLQQEIRYDEVWSQTAETTDWILVSSGAARTPRNASAATYDEFGRLAAKFAPEDAPDSPSERLRWELGSARSRVVIERRSQVGGPFDRTTVRCFDGLGRQYQERVQVDEGAWLVNGYSVFNHSGKVRTGFDRYQGQTGTCDTEPPQDLPRQELTYDAAGRVLTDTWISGEDRWFSRNEYGPGYGVVWDHGDTDPDNPHFDTPRRTDHDGQGRNTSVTLDMGQGQVATYRFGWDELGRLAQITDPDGNVKLQSYDMADQMVAVDDPDRGRTVYTRDAAGNVVREVDARGVETVSQVDAMGRLVRQWDAADREGTMVSYRYDAPGACPERHCTNPAGRLVEVAFPLDGMERGHDWYGYDTGGSMVAHERQLAGHTFAFGWEFDHTGLLTQRSYPDGRHFDFRFDAAERLIAVDGVLDETRFHDNGARVSRRRFANGVEQGLAFDGRFRVTQRDVVGPGGADILAYRYTYDASGNVLQLADDTVSGDTASQNAAFTYDALSRLSTAQLDPGRGGLEETMAYDYNALGNMTRKASSRGADSPDHVGALTYGGEAPHQVTAAGGLTFAYDATGNMTRRGDASLTWDAWGRLTEVDSGGDAVSSWYGPGYNRVLRSSNEGGTVFYVADDYEIRDGIAAIEIEADEIAFARHESASLAAEVLSDVAPATAPDGQIDVADAWVSEASGQGDPATHLLAAATARLLLDEQTTWLHTDHTGSVVATTDADGDVLEELSYYPHGVERGTGQVETHGFQSQERERETGLVHFGARQLDPWLGRWISADPAFALLDEASLRNVDEEVGAYAFVGNNPARYRDANGQFLGLVIRGVGAVAGGAVGAYDWVTDTKREDEILNKKSTLATHIGWGVAGVALGALDGFLNPGVGVGANLIDIGVSRWVDGALGQVFAGQNLVTAKRLTRTFTTAALSIGLIVGLGTLTGGIAPALGLAITGAAALGKLVYYINDHATQVGKANDAAQLKRIGSAAQGRRRGSTVASVSAGQAPESAVAADTAAGYDTARGEGETPDAERKRRRARAGNKQVRRR